AHGPKLRLGPGEREPPCPLLVNSWLGRARGYSLEYAQPRSTVATPNASRTLERASVVMSRHDVMVVTTPPESACCLFAHGSPLRHLAVLELPGALRSARRSPRALVWPGMRRLRAHRCLFRPTARPCHSRGSRCSVRCSKSMNSA